jgi:putative AlgH/UPF0301 family transcriptional regulator
MDLTGKMIVAMPAMGDTRFQRAVILICAHTAQGAMGLIINKPLTELSFSDLLTQLKIQRGGRILVGRSNAGAALFCTRPTIPAGRPLRRLPAPMA